MIIVFVIFAALGALTCYCCCVAAGRADKALAEWREHDASSNKME